MCVAEVEQHFEALGFVGFAFQFAVAKRETAEFVAKVAVFLASVVQVDISGPDAADRGETEGAASLDRRHQLNGPVADEVDVAVALDLESKQQNLREDQAREQGQGTM